MEARRGLAFPPRSQMEELRSNFKANKTKDVQLLAATELSVEQRSRMRLMACISVYFTTFLTCSSEDLILLCSGETAAHLLHLSLETESRLVCFDLSASPERAPQPCCVSFYYCNTQP